MTKQYIVCLLCFFVGLTACKEDTKEVVPDVSHIEIKDVKIKRFDLALGQLDTTNVEEGCHELEEKFPELYKVYMQNVMGYMDAEDQVDYQSFADYINFAGTRFLLDTIAQVFDDVSDIETDFTKAFRYAKYYIPEFKIPIIYSLTSNFNYQRFLFEDNNTDGVGISLEFYLNPGYDYKALDPQNPTFSDYLTRAFTREHIVKNTVELVLDDYVGNPNGVRLLDQMIHNGKKIYLLDKILPFVHDSIIMEYTGQQLAWCDINMEEMWSFYLDQKLLYETHPGTINKYVNPSPSSPSMPTVAPGRTANYLGWHIVKAYMKRHPKTTIDNLLKLNDAQRFLEESRFRPRNK